MESDLIIIMKDEGSWLESEKRIQTRTNASLDPYSFDAMFPLLLTLTGGHEPVPWKGRL